MKMRSYNARKRADATGDATGELIDGLLDIQPNHSLGAWDGHVKGPTTDLRHVPGFGASVAYWMAGMNERWVYSISAGATANLAYLYVDSLGGLDPFMMRLRMFCPTTDLSAVIGLHPVIGLTAADALDFELKYFSDRVELKCYDPSAVTNSTQTWTTTSHVNRVHLYEVRRSSTAANKGELWVDGVLRLSETGQPSEGIDELHVGRAGVTAPATVRDGPKFASVIWGDKPIAPNFDIPYTRARGLRAGVGSELSGRELRKAAEVGGHGRAYLLRDY